MSQDRGGQKTGSERLKQLLKGVGVVLTVLSLVSGLRSLSGLYSESRDASVMTRSSLTAATLMADTGEFELAWDELERAAEYVAEPELLPYRIDVALRWVEQLGLAGRSAEQLNATADRVLPYLYQALSEPTGFTSADVQAHIAWASYVRNSAEARPAELIANLQPALADDPENANLRSMLGFLKSRNGFDSFDRVTAHFDAVPAANRSDWSERVELITYANLMAYELDRDPAHQDILVLTRRALPLAVQQLNSGLFEDELPLWLWMLGFREETALVEQIVDLAEPDAYIAFLDAAYQNATPTNVARYLYARLEELRANPAAARDHLAYFTDSWAANAHPPLLALVQSMQARLALPVASIRPHGRLYYSDERPADVDELAFHLETLLYFDEDVYSDNLVEAATYLDALTTDELTPEIRAAVIASRNRVKEYTDRGERWLLEAPDDGETEGELVVPRAQLEILWYLVGRLAYIDGDLDAAIVEWSDAHSRWIDYIDLLWPLATAHAGRAGLESTPGDLRDADRVLAVDYLEAWVEWLRQSNEVVPWDRIRSEPAFKSIADTDGFRRLTRGRP